NPRIHTLGETLGSRAYQRMERTLSPQQQGLRTTHRIERCDDPNQQRPPDATQAHPPEPSGIPLPTHRPEPRKHAGTSRIASEFDKGIADDNQALAIDP